MTPIFISAITVAALLLIISTIYTMKNRYFENQVRSMSEQYARLSIDIKNETDTDRVFKMHDQAEKLKSDIELLIGKYPKVNRGVTELPPLPEISEVEPIAEMSLGNLMRHYDKENNSSVIYAKFNSERKDS